MNTGKRRLLRICLYFPQNNYQCNKLLLEQRPSLKWTERGMCVFKDGTLPVRSQTFIQKFRNCMREKEGKEIYIPTENASAFERWRF